VSSERTGALTLYARPYAKTLRESSRRTIALRSCLYVGALNANFRKDLTAARKRTQMGRRRVIQRPVRRFELTVARIVL